MKEENTTLAVSQASSDVNGRVQANSDNIFSRKLHLSPLSYRFPERLSHFTEMDEFPLGMLSDKTM